MREEKGDIDRESKTEATVYEGGEGELERARKETTVCEGGEGDIDRESKTGNNSG